jgi:hypothetical protein
MEQTEKENALCSAGHMFFSEICKQRYSLSPERFYNISDLLSLYDLAMHSGRSEAAAVIRVAIEARMPWNKKDEQS